MAFKTKTKRHLNVVLSFVIPVNRLQKMISISLCLCEEKILESQPV